MLAPRIVPRTILWALSVIGAILVGVPLGAGRVILSQRAERWCLRWHLRGRR